MMIRRVGCAHALHRINERAEHDTPTTIPLPWLLHWRVFHSRRYPSRADEPELHGSPQVSSRFDHVRMHTEGHCQSPSPRLFVMLLFHPCWSSSSFSFPPLTLVVHRLILSRAGLRIDCVIARFERF